ncbi:unnamed protein product, partial [marine sediment metagenome]
RDEVDALYFQMQDCSFTGEWVIGKEDGIVIVCDTYAAKKVKMIVIAMGKSYRWKGMTAYIDDITINGTTYELERIGPPNWTRTLSQDGSDLTLTAESSEYYLKAGESENFAFFWKTPAEGTYALKIWGYAPGAELGNPAFGPLEVQVTVDGTPPTIIIKVVQEGVEIPNLVGNKYDDGVAHVVIEASEEVSLGALNVGVAVSALVRVPMLAVQE